MRSFFACCARKSFFPSQHSLLARRQIAEVTEVPPFDPITNFPTIAEDTHDGAGGRGAKLTPFAFACACFAAMSSLLLGYDIGIMSSAILFIRPQLGLNDVQSEVSMAPLFECPCLCIQRK